MIAHLLSSNSTKLTENTLALCPEGNDDLLVNRAQLVLIQLKKGAAPRQPGHSHETNPPSEG
ncbi:MAG: hypothetical protein ACRDEA_00680, partial [Microcystaceae cyanobacterium]